VNEKETLPDECRGGVFVSGGRYFRLCECVSTPILALPVEELFSFMRKRINQSKCSIGDIFNLTEEERLYLFDLVWPAGLNSVLFLEEELL